MRTVKATVARATAMLRDEGPTAVLGRIKTMAKERVFLSEDHVWYGLDLTRDRPRKYMPDGVELVRAKPTQVRRVAELGQSPYSAEFNHAEGHDLWLAMSGDDLLFCCWTFRGVAPLLAAPGGTLDLPEQTVLLEDSFSSPKARGRGIAPASWSRIADLLYDEDVRKIVTKVETTNRPSRRAVEKAGFAEAAVMSTTRVGSHKEASMTPIGAGSDMGEELAEKIVV